jgi:hypothetical protein
VAGNARRTFEEQFVQGVARKPHIMIKDWLTSDFFFSSAVGAARFGALP